MATDRRIRISDRDRAAYDEVLRTAYAEGRISDAELEERLTSVFEAQFEDDLLPVVSDLPADHLRERAITSASDAAAVDDPDRSGGALRHAGPFMLPPLICTAIYAMTDFGGYFWPMWVWFGCMIPVAASLLDPD